MPSIRLFRTGKPTPNQWIIQESTSSKYFHCGIILDVNHIDCILQATVTKSIYLSKIEPHDPNVEIFDIPIPGLTSEQVFEWGMTYCGHNYGVMDILLYPFRRAFHLKGNSSGFTCSELVAKLFLDKYDIIMDRKNFKHLYMTASWYDLKDFLDANARSELTPSDLAFLFKAP